MDKFEEMALLLDIYGNLLTDKQREVMDQYYNYDLSLQEIAENEGISKQGVHDLIRRSEHTLVKTDEKLGFKDRLSDIQAGLERVNSSLIDIGKHRALDATGQDTADLRAALESCRTEIERLINTCMGG